MHQVIQRPKIKKINDDLYEIINLDGFLYNSSYVLFKNRKAIIVDPSFNTPAILELLEKKQLKVVGIILTHGHWDHWFTAKQLFNQTNLKLKCSQLDEVIVNETNKSISHYFPDYDQKDVDQLIIEYCDWTQPQKIKIDEFELNILPTPGHTEGCVCFEYENYVFSGDHVFSDSIGYTRYINSKPELMKQNVWKFLNIYDDNKFVLPGHGEGFFLKKQRKILEAIAAGV